MSFTNEIVDDLKYATRQIWRAPAFVCVVTIVLALAVGANTTILSLLNAVVFRQLQLPAAERLAVISVMDERGLQTRPIYYSTFVEMRKLPSFAALTLYSGGGILWTEARGVVGEGGIEAVTPGFHEALGLVPFLGRFFDDRDAPGDGVPALVTVISHRFWQRYYAGDPAAIGEQLLVNQVPFTVIGVTPPEYSGLYVETGVDFAVPAGVLGRQLGTNQFPVDPGRPLRGLSVVGRLRADVPMDQARRAFETAWEALRIESIPAGISPAERIDAGKQHIKIDTLVAGLSTLRNRYGDRLRMLAAVSAVFLAIGSLNVAGLWIARAAVRERELAVHIALGASGGRLARRLLIESVAISILGSAFGVLIAWWASSVLTSVLWEASTTLGLSTTPDSRVLALSLLISLGTGVLVGIVPACRSGRQQPVAVMGRTTTKPLTRWTKGLLATQVALSLVLTFMAGLFATTLTSLRALDPSVDANGLMWTRALQQPGGYRGMNDEAYYPELVRAIGSLPGIQSVALSHHFPAFYNFGNQVTSYAIGRSESGDAHDAASGMMEFVSPRFFETIGVAVIRGRDFSWSDDRAHPAVVIVNESLGRALFANGDAVGRRIRIGDDPERRSVEVIGVVRDATMGAYRMPHQPVAFRPKLQEPRFLRAPVVVFHTNLPLAEADRVVARAVLDLGREYVRRMYTFDEQVDIALLQERLTAGLSSAFAGLSLLIGAVGLYALLAYSVSSRTRELGVRMAVGASGAALIGMVIREALAITLVGVAIGIPCALAAGRLVQSMLFGLSPWELGTLIGPVLIFLAIAIVAGILPAWRASSVSPTTALRCD